ncbi:MAG: DUF2153 family protein [Candidatus Bathyarchaeota archaeon]
MSDRWIQVSQKILDQIKSLEKHKERDRLELVSSMQIALGGLEMSLRGWKQWISNPNVMTRFKKEDLEKMNKKLVDFTRAFIEYDLEATKLGMKRGLKARKKTKEKKKEPEAYVT